MCVARVLVYFPRSATRLHETLSHDTYQSLPQIGKGQLNCGGIKSASNLETLWVLQSQGK